VKDRLDKAQVMVDEANRRYELVLTRALKAEEKLREAGVR
jgi:hypothetical protein